MLRRCPANFPDRVIHGDRFAAIADVELNWNAGGARIARGLEHLGRGARIIFVKTDLIPQTFAWLAKIPRPEPFILVTHNGDFPITRQLFESAPGCVSRWYGLNVDHSAPNLIPIPSGMERPGGGGYSADYTKVPAAWRSSASAGRRHLAFACWNEKNNPAARSTARAAFEGRSGIVWRDHGVTHQDFLTMCGESRFVISPPGNGIDCHRTWEAMYMGAIPLVRRSHHTNGFADLPMVAVENWDSLTNEMLAQTYARYERRAWGLDKLFFPYWEDVIRRDALTL